MDRRSLEGLPVIEQGFEQALLNEWAELEIDQPQDSCPANRGFVSAAAICTHSLGLVEVTLRETGDLRRSR
jgi:hypothetical protein